MNRNKNPKTPPQQFAAARPVSSHPGNRGDGAPLAPSVMRNRQPKFISPSAFSHVPRCTVGPVSVSGCVCFLGSNYMSIHITLLHILITIVITLITNHIDLCVLISFLRGHRPMGPTVAAPRQPKGDSHNVSHRLMLHLTTPGERVCHLWGSDQ